MRGILCDISVNEWNGSDGEILFTSSPISCLSLTEIQNPDFVFIRFSYGSIELNSKLIELCTCLKRDRRITSIPVIALLDYPQRVLVEKLIETGVTFIAYLTDPIINKQKLTHYYRSSDSQLEPFTTAASVCPFLNYEVYNANEEISLCGADYNRLVINKRRMNHFCSNRNHLSCPFYLNPKTIKRFTQLELP
ncbi:hypothetical protein [Oceanispirochaeta sp.]|jgi:CheY-like chemotaxis protein|uniref:hypothetical protein n=1 Tax=Oceanispirochaeta sp. TaxID=2035350 RepID=UPI00261A2CF9|nr:hypothetical protein [Oceanispirochaeta sp.]MDA3957595.1 hypothetical protein [Oceanispirochaeta sp.]